jgi:blue copper oxidase
MCVLRDDGRTLAEDGGYLPCRRNPAAAPRRQIARGETDQGARWPSGARNMKRRDLLAWMGLGTLAGVGGDLIFRARPTGAAPPAPLVADPQSSFVPDVELALHAGPGDAQILPGARTHVWAYTGRVVKGPPETLQEVPGSYLGPVIRVRTGQKIRIRFTHDLPEPTIVHWHGLHVPARMDGHPRFMIARGQTYVYEFEVVNRAGTYWYHPHHHNRTGPQVYAGLAGLLIVSDEAEAALDLPSGTDELCWVLQDRVFDRGNQFIYGAGMQTQQMNGFLGDRVLVNGQERPSLELGTGAYRVRLLNGSNSRIYKLAWDNGTPITLIGTDGGLLERPGPRPYLTLAPGERADLILDLRQHRVGASLGLRSLPFSGVESGMGMGMGRMMRGASALPNGAPLSILTVQVQRRETSRFQLPARLSTFDTSWQPEETGRMTPRLFTVTSAGMQWLLNGRAFDMEGVASNETVSLGSKEVWEFANPGGGMMGMRMAHPLHVHGRQFRVLSRQVDPLFAKDSESLRDGFSDEGWKDTGYGPGDAGRARACADALHTLSGTLPVSLPQPGARRHGDDAELPRHRVRSGSTRYFAGSALTVAMFSSQISPPLDTTLAVI